MVRKNTRYNALLLGWAVLTLGGAAAVLSGYAAPLLTPSMLPLSGPSGLALVVGGPFLVGVSVIVLLKRRAWRRAGRRAGLSPDGWGLLGYPDLTGTRNGRTVTARTVKRGSDGPEGSSRTYTIVEAALDEPSPDSIVVMVGDGTGKTGFGALATQMETTAVGEFQTVTDAPDRTEQLLTQRTRTALGEPDRLDAVFVGDPSTVVADALSDADGLMGHLAGAFDAQIEQMVPGDAATVTTQTKGVALDGGELDRQVDAVATVANEFERTRPRDAAVQG